MWTTPGLLYGTNAAEGNLREELNRTWQSQQAGLQEMAEYAAVARANPTPTEYGLREAVADAYGRGGVVRSDADIDAATKAVVQDQARVGLGQSPYTLELQPDGSIATLVGRDDRSMEIKSLTTAAEIEQARSQPASPTVAPRSDAPGASDPSGRGERRGSDDALLDDAANPRHGMFRQAFEPVRMRDTELGRASDETSIRLAAGMTADARARGLETIAFAQFSPDGRRFYMADTPDPSSPVARTAVGDVAQSLQQSVADSSERVAQLDRAQAVAQLHAPPMQQQTQDQAGAMIQGPRLV